MEVKEASGGDGKRPPWVNLVSAFFAMEPSDSLISISRDCGGGAITENVQYFIWNQCISKTDGKGHTPYVTSFLKKVVLEVESAADVVIDELYEQLSFYMTSFKGDDLAKGAPRIIREISFIYPTDHVEARVCQNPRKVVVPLSCSLNMLEGDTGCSIWPSSLFLSEFVLSCPELFSMKSCFELGSGVGLVGICLAHVKPSKVVLSDGDLSTLANLKVNLELNHMNIQSFSSESEVKCLHLPWESAVESDLQDLMPDIVLGADVIYDPQCIPHLVHVIATLLTTKKSNSLLRDGSKVSVAPNDQINSDIPNGYDEFVLASTTQPVAYIASVVRNINTYNYFHKVAQEANLRVVDITQNVKIFNFLPYMLSYQRSSVRLLGIYQSFR
ncbi:putative lysine methyltransferase, S-adenosyl-L-methionine-dependent methyltransferase [Helianthus debilis subsp. tardiflorus]